jgi:membrane fusion protein, multidrug efflux system
MISKKRVFIAGGIAVWVILAVIADRALAGSSTSVETDDAYVTAHYSVIAPKVSGLIDRVDVNDNQYVLAGQELARG